MKKSGFTLIELIIAAVIIGILASIAVPICSSIKKKAIACEAVTAMGCIREAEREYFIVNNEYIVGVNIENSNLNIKLNDFNGVYFSYDCFDLFAKGSNPLVIRCRPGLSVPSRSPKAQEVVDWTGGRSIWIRMAKYMPMIPILAIRLQYGICRKEMYEKSYAINNGLYPARCVLCVGVRFFRRYDQHVSRPDFQGKDIYLQR